MRVLRRIFTRPDQLRVANEQLAERVREREQALERLRQSEERYRLLVEKVTDYAIFMLDPSGLVTTWNAGAERIKGYKPGEIIGRHFSIFYTPADRELGRPARALDTAARIGKYEGEHIRVRKDGSHFWANVVIDALRDQDGHLIGFAKITRDVTERRQAREELERTRAELAQAQKMDAIGQLAGGVAHDLNNWLTTVIGNLDLVLRRGNIPESNQAPLAAAMRGAERSAALVAKLLAFSRKQILEPEIADLNKLISHSSDLMRSALGETIGLEVVLAGGLWRTMVDPNLMETALLNLVINARDSMPNGGLVTVETANAHLDGDYAKAHQITPGQYVMIAVSDTGQGMTETTLARAFEPFYTTKPPGEGSGLGLSQVYGFVKQSNGHIKLYSETGRGSTAKIYLPKLVADVEAERAASPSLRASTPAGHELILVVEDNEEVRAFTSGVLTQLGYRVLDVEAPEPALELIKTRHDIGLLFTDIVLSQMNGRALAEEARRLRPGLKVLFTSGYTENAIVHHGRLDPGVQFLTKPFKLDTLGRKVRDALDT